MLLHCEKLETLMSEPGQTGGPRTLAVSQLHVNEQKVCRRRSGVSFVSPHAALRPSCVNPTKEQTFTPKGSEEVMCTILLVIACMAGLTYRVRPEGEI